MPEFAFRLIRLGKRLQVVVFHTPGSAPVLKKSIPFDSAAIQDDKACNVSASKRSTPQNEMQFETWKTTEHPGLTNGGLELTVDFQTKRFILTPISPRSKEPIDSNSIEYNFRDFGVQDGRETKIDKAKDEITFTIKKSKQTNNASM